MKNINRYILEKLQLNKGTISREVRVLFCQLRFVRKINQIIPDLIEIISETDNDIEFRYITNNYNQEGVIKKLKKTSFNNYFAKCPDTVVISTQYETKHFAILNHDDGLKVLKDMYEKLKITRTFKYCWEDVILDKNFNRSVGGYICYQTENLPNHKIPDPKNNNIMEPKQLQDLIDEL